MSSVASLVKAFSCPSYFATEFFISCLNFMFSEFIWVMSLSLDEMISIFIFSSSSTFGLIFSLYSFSNSRSLDSSTELIFLSMNSSSFAFLSALAIIRSSFLFDSLMVLSSSWSLSFIFCAYSLSMPWTFSVIFLLISLRILSFVLSSSAIFLLALSGSILDWRISSARACSFILASRSRWLSSLTLSIFSFASFIMSSITSDSSSSVLVTRLSRRFISAWAFAMNSVISALDSCEPVSTSDKSLSLSSRKAFWVRSSLSSTISSSFSIVASLFCSNSRLSSFILFSSSPRSSFSSSPFSFLISPLACSASVLMLLSVSEPSWLISLLAEIFSASISFFVFAMNAFRSSFARFIRASNSSTLFFDLPSSSFKPPALTA